MSGIVNQVVWELGDSWRASHTSPGAVELVFLQDVLDHILEIILCFHQTLQSKELLPPLLCAVREEVVGLGSPGVVG